MNECRTVTERVPGPEDDHRDRKGSGSEDDHRERKGLGAEASDVIEKRPVQKTITVNETQYKSVMVTENEVEDRHPESVGADDGYWAAELPRPDQEMLRSVLQPVPDDHDQVRDREAL